MERLLVCCAAFALCGVDAQTEQFYPTECRMTIGGHEYSGYKNSTSEGTRCQRWDSNAPHNNNYRNSPERFPDDSVSDAENFCRNPTPNWHSSAWCYTADPAVRWQSCDIPLCECKVAPDGSDYGGDVSVTASGLTCQRWDAQSPHAHNFTDNALFVVAAADLTRNNNYCRNPRIRADDGGAAHSGGPWCYTTDNNVVWEYCNVTTCDTSALRITTTTPAVTATATTATSTTSHPAPTTPHRHVDAAAEKEDAGDLAAGELPKGKEPGVGASMAQQHSTSTAAIAGGVVGAIFFLLLLVAGLVILYRRRVACFAGVGGGDGPPKSFDNPTYETERGHVKFGEGLPGQLHVGDEDGGYVTMDNRKQ